MQHACSQCGATEYLTYAGKDDWRCPPCQAAIIDANLADNPIVPHIKHPVQIRRRTSRGRVSD